MRRRHVILLLVPSAVLACQSLLDFKASEREIVYVEGGPGDGDVRDDTGSSVDAADDVAPLDATTPFGCDGPCEAALVHAGFARPNGLASDGVEIFIAEGQKGQLGIRAYALDGGAIRLVVGNLTTEPMHLAVDDTYVYYGTTSAEAGAIRRVRKDGDGGPSTLVDCFGACPGVAVRGTKLFFTDRKNDRVFELDLAVDGGAPRDLNLQLARNGVQPEYIEDVDAVDDLLFITDDRGDAAFAFDPAAAKVKEVSVQSPSGIAAEDAAVWIASEEGGVIYRVPRDFAAGSPQEVVRNQKTPIGLVIVGGAVYWTNHESGELMRLALPPK